MSSSLDDQHSMLNEKIINSMARLSQWYVYIVRCNDHSLYTGITNDPDRRVTEHNDSSKNSKGAKYTRARQPVSLVYVEGAKNKSTASQREWEIKKLNRQQKLLLITLND